MGTWIEARPKLVIPGVLNSVEDEDEVHITMAYLGAADHNSVVEMLTATGTKHLYRDNQWPVYGPIVCEISGTAQWRDASNKLFRVALVAPPTSLPDQNETLYTVRDRMINKLRAMSGTDEYPVVSVDETYPFVPHVTLPSRFQVDSDTKCMHGTQYNIALPTLPARTMFIVDKFYVSTGTANEPDSYQHTAI